MSENKKPIVIMGATASGKTDISLCLAKKINAEIISADSRQVYKHLSAGTAKPEGRWDENNENYLVGGIPYHLVDFLEPTHQYNAGDFALDANKKIKQIKEKGKKVIITGGTGLYIHALFNQMDNLPKPDQSLREELLNYAQTKGTQALYQKLNQLDPISAQRIHPNNTHRIIRALEISILAGKPASSLISGNFFKISPELFGNFILIKWRKNILVERIKTRTINSFENWVKETLNLISLGYPYDCPGLKSIGYSVVIDFIENKIDKKNAIEQIVKLTLNYAKRQNTWFSRYKNAVILEFDELSKFNPEEISDKIIKLTNF